MRGASERVLRAHGCRFTDNFAGFQFTGNYDAASIGGADSIALPEGSTEFMCHPGRTAARSSAPAGTRLKESREQELRALDRAGGTRRARRRERPAGGVRSVVAAAQSRRGWSDVAAQREVRHELGHVEASVQNRGGSGGAGPVAHESKHQSRRFPPA